MYEKSYHAKVIKTDPVREKKARRRRKKKIIFYTIIGVVCATVLIFLLRLPVLQLKTVRVEGTEVVDPVDIQTAVFKRLEGNYLFVIPKTNILLLPLPSIERMLAGAFPRLQTITLSRSSISTLAIKVSEYHAKYLWCDSSCFFMDQNGMVYSSAPYFSGTTYPKIFNTQAKELPFSPLSAQELSMIDTLSERLPQMKIVLEEIHFDTTHTARIIFPHNGSLATLYIDPGVSIEKTLDNLYSGIRTDPLSSLFADKTKVLQYIDMRYGDRVIYKFE